MSVKGPELRGDLKGKAKIECLIDVINRIYYSPIHETSTDTDQQPDHNGIATENGSGSSSLDTEDMPSLNSLVYAILSCPTVLDETESQNTYLLQLLYKPEIIRVVIEFVLQDGHTEDWNTEIVQELLIQSEAAIESDNDSEIEVNAESVKRSAGSADPAAPVPTAQTSTHQSPTTRQLVSESEHVETVSPESTNKENLELQTQQPNIPQAFDEIETVNGVQSQNSEDLDASESTLSQFSSNLSADSLELTREGSSGSNIHHFDFNVPLINTIEIMKRGSLNDAIAPFVPLMVYSLITNPTTHLDTLWKFLLHSFTETVVLYLTDSVDNVIGPEVWVQGMKLNSKISDALLSVLGFLCRKYPVLLDPRFEETSPRNSYLYAIDQPTFVDKLHKHGLIFQLIAILKREEDELSLINLEQFFRELLELAQITRKDVFLSEALEENPRGIVLLAKDILKEPVLEALVSYMVISKHYMTHFSDTLVDLISKMALEFNLYRNEILPAYQLDDNSSNLEIETTLSVFGSYISILAEIMNKGIDRGVEENIEGTSTSYISKRCFYEQVKACRLVSDLLKLAIVADTGLHTDTFDHDSTKRNSSDSNENDEMIIVRDHFLDHEEPNSFNLRTGDENHDNGSDLDDIGDPPDDDYDDLGDPDMQEDLDENMKTNEDVLHGMRQLSLYSRIKYRSHKVFLRQVVVSNSIPVLLDIFFRYPWNSFVHESVYSAVSHLLSPLYLNSILSEEYLSILKILFEKTQITKRILNGARRNAKYEAIRKIRLGYMGALINIGNAIKDATTVLWSFRPSSFAETLRDILKPYVKDPEWVNFVQGTLADTTKKWVQLGTGFELPTGASKSHYGAIILPDIEGTFELDDEQKEYSRRPSETNGKDESKVETAESENLQESKETSDENFTTGQALPTPAITGSVIEEPSDEDLALTRSESHRI